MIIFDEVKAMLDDISDELPEAFYKELNGGVILSPDEKLHPASDEKNPLFILGEYHYQRFGLGRYIVIYYGSFAKTFSYLQPEKLKERLRKTLFHEFTHHLESLAGDKSLEVKDAQDLQKYKQRFL